MQDLFNNKDEEQFEDEYFREDSRKNKIRLLVSLGAMFLMVLVLLFVLLIGKKEDKNKDKVQDTIVEYAKENETGFLKEELPSADVEEKKSETEIIDRNKEDEVTPEPTATPEEQILPTPAPDEPVMETDVKKFDKVKYDTKSNLKEMESFFQQGNYEALYDLSHLDRFIAMSYSFKGTTDFAYYGDVDSNGKPSGKGIAVYTDNQYYYGDWVNGVREGDGLWLHYHIHLKDNFTDPITFHQFQGKFHNDLPEGPGQDHYEYDSLLLVANNVYLTNYLGEYKEGKVSGPIYMTATDKDGHYYEFDGVANEPGTFEYISESIDKMKRGPALTDRNNPDNFYWITKADNRNIGVKGYISANKK